MALVSSLRTIIEHAGGSLNDWTVLAAQHDPYRQDTPVNHELGKWFADQLDLHPGPDGRRHLRGLHYALLNSSPIKPDGKPYRNTEDDWKWLSERASKAARWLGYVPFDSIIDARNDQPIIREHERNTDQPWANFSFDPYVSLDAMVSFAPDLTLHQFHCEQRFQLALFGEKSSLEPIVAPIAETLNADLFLGTGELSDTLLHRMASEGAEDGRKLIVFSLSDFDPSGLQMTVSIARKLQAFRDLLFPELSFEVHQVALTVEQVNALNLPSEPLKDTELRGDRWREAWGREQTEIDSLVELYPDYLEQLILDAAAPYYDDTLAERVHKAKAAWQRKAQKKIAKALERLALDDLEAEAEQVIEDARARLDKIEERARDMMEGVEVENELPPTPKLPEPNCVGNGSTVLINSDWTWEDQTTALREHRAYKNGGAA